MSNLQDLLKKLTTSAVSTMSYVYYDKETGKIHKISSRNVAEEGFEVFEIENDEVNPILTGERRTEEFTITYDVSLKQIRLKEVAYDDTHKTAATLCYQLPMIKRVDKSAYLQDYTKEVAPLPQYIGMYIDVWYEELPHLAGQHVWINDTVYKLLKDQPANTKFTTDNAELIVENVKLYRDKNKALKINDTVDVGDLILKHNNIFVFDLADCNINLENDIVIRQDTDFNIWNIRINPHTKKFLRMSGYNPNETLYFSVTEKYNPNILYRSLEFNVGELLSESVSIIPFICDAEHDPNNVSIYTARYFDKYVHEII
jgi:hypothetical protein